MRDFNNAGGVLKLSGRGSAVENTAVSEVERAYMQCRRCVLPLRLFEEGASEVTVLVLYLHKYSIFLFRFRGPFLTRSDREFFFSRLGWLFVDVVVGVLMNRLRCIRL